MSKLLNELMATKVMGWRLNTHYGDKQHYPYQMYERPNMDAIPTHEFQPSTNISDALLCLERAANEVSKGLGFSIEKFPDDKWDARVFNGCTAQAFANADSAPLAMCICSLRAMGVPESEIQEAMK